MVTFGVIIRLYVFTLANFIANYFIFNFLNIYTFIRYDRIPALKKNENNETVLFFTLLHIFLYAERNNKNQNKHKDFIRFCASYFFFLSHCRCWTVLLFNTTQYHQRQCVCAIDCLIDFCVWTVYNACYMSSRKIGIHVFFHMNSHWFARSHRVVKFNSFAGKKNSKDLFSITQFIAVVVYAADLTELSFLNTEIKEKRNP